MTKPKEYSAKLYEAYEGLDPEDQEPERLDALRVCLSNPGPFAQSLLPESGVQFVKAEGKRGCLSHVKDALTYSGARWSKPMTVGEFSRGVREALKSAECSNQDHEADYMRYVLGD